jgi:hypothetical protein
MAIPTYTPGYPPDGSSLGQTKSTMRNNLDGTFETLAVDHIDNNGQPGSKPAGYHKVVHMVPQASNPAPVTNFGQLYSKTINSFTTDQALFWETGAGLIQQLTTNLTPLATNSGYTFLPGGIIVQWGRVTSTNSTFTLQNYNITFPNACFCVFAQIYGTGTEPSGAGTIDIRFSQVLAASFQWCMITQSDKYTGFFWVAIGN